MLWRLPKKVDVYITSVAVACFDGQRKVALSRDGPPGKRVAEAFGELEALKPTDVAVWFSSSLVEFGTLPAITGRVRHGDLEVLIHRSLAEDGQTAAFELAIGSADEAGHRTWAAIPADWLESVRNEARTRSWRLESAAPFVSALVGAKAEVDAETEELTLLVEEDAVTVLPSGQAVAGELFTYRLSEFGLAPALERASLKALDPARIRWVGVVQSDMAEALTNQGWQPSARWSAPAWAQG